MDKKHRASGTADVGGGDAPAWYTPGLAHIWLPYAQMKTVGAPLPVVRTEGCRIVLADGRELVDGIASWWTACHGYNHPHIRAAVERQLAVMPHVMFGGLAHEQALTLAPRLAALLPGDLDRVFFSDPGSVAVEVAMKMAVQYGLNRGRRRGTRFVCFKGGYHGDTTGAMAVCDPEAGMHALFHGLLPEHFCLDLPRDEESAAALSVYWTPRRRHRRHHRRAVGAGAGMRFHDADVLRRLRARQTLRVAADLR
jgi:adenosylmethionine-8-amino-7-oxononanoate aminotransferase